MDNYNKIYEDVINENYEVLPHYIKKDLRLYIILFKKFYYKYRTMPSNSMFVGYYVENCVELLNILKKEEKEYIDDDFMSFYSEITYKINSTETIKTILRPDDTEDDYIFRMSVIVKDHLFKFNMDMKVKFEPLMKLIDILNYINHNYTIYLQDANVISLIIAYCYLYNDSYDYLINYLDNPDYFMDKIRNSGIKLDSNNHFDLHSEEALEIYKNIDNFFKKDKIIIK